MQLHALHFEQPASLPSLTRTTVFVVVEQELQLQKLESLRTIVFVAEQELQLYKHLEQPAPLQPWTIVFVAEQELLILKRRFLSFFQVLRYLMRKDRHFSYASLLCSFVEIVEELLLL